VNASKTDSSSEIAGAPANSEENGAAAAAQRSEQQLQAGESELAAARAYLNGAGSARDSSKAARLLWAAVGNGNSTAEVMLANLYARGDGVPMNCEQGKILLVAAIKAGNMEAQQKLKDLNLNGCK
jgi:TPR repeat protein